MKKRILCYGDSNTWGYIPGRGGRYGEDIRWTGVLASRCGPDYAVIEEGLNGRTTVFDDPTVPGRNGLAYLAPCLRSHLPLDLVTVMLGSNDLKTIFHANARFIAAGKRRILEEIACFREKEAGPKVLLIAPASLLPSVSSLSMEFDERSQEESALLKDCYRELAADFGCRFLDAGSVCTASEADGLHLDEKAHAQLAGAVYGVVRELLE